MDLQHRQCLNHGSREAVARCPDCKQFFCRECIAEHDDRVICASCLRKLRRARDVRRNRFTWLTRAVLFCVSIAGGWLAFYWVGRFLLSIPVSVHDGTIWQTTFWQE